MTLVTNRHIASLDGLRTLAIVLVLAFHLTPGANSNLGLRSLPFKVADLGWSGVDLFFVLSGFLITSKLLAARDEPHRFRRFYARRALRIFPLYVSTLLFVFVLLPLIAGIPRDPLSAQLPYWLYYANFVRPELHVEEIVSLGHFWSLAIEEQFYLAWPAVVFLGSARLVRWACVAIVAGSPLLRFVLATNGFDYAATYAWTPSRMDALALGALVAFAYALSFSRARMVRLSWIVMALTAPLAAWAAWRDKASLVIRSLDSPEAVLVRALLPSAVALLFTALLVLALEVPAFSRPLSGRWQTAIARYSYGIYVVHYLLAPPLKRMLLPQLRSWPANVAAAGFFVVASVLSLLIAIATYHGFEARFLAWKPGARSGRRSGYRTESRWTNFHP